MDDNFNNILTLMLVLSFLWYICNQSKVKEEQKEYIVNNSSIM